MTRWFTLLVLVALVVGCQSETLEKVSVTKGKRHEEKPSFVVGFTPSGDVALFDGKTGEVLGSVRGGDGTAVDVAFDPWRRGVWVFEQNEDASGGEIRFCPVQIVLNAAPMLGECAHSAWVDGLAALYAAPEGLWVFEDGPAGARWKILRQGLVAKGMSAPRPASIWMENEQLKILSYGFYDDKLWKFGVTHDDGAPMLTEELDWGEPRGYPPTTRYVRQTDDAGLLFDVAEGVLVVRRVKSGQVEGSESIGVGHYVGRIEAVGLIGSNALVLGADALWIVAVGQGGVESVSSVWLDGDIRRSLLFFSRDLLVVSDRAFVATNRGVVAIELKKSDGIVFGMVDEGFVGVGIRGPMDEIRAE